VLEYDAEMVETFLSANGIAAEIHVEQDYIGFERIHEVYDALGLRGHLYLLCIRFEKKVEGEEHVLVVVDNEYLSFRFHLLMCVSLSIWQR